MALPSVRTRDGQLPARGWTKPGEVILCDVCGERCHVWQLHHLDPIGWGGNPSRKVEDHQLVWVISDGRCHDTIHMILDHARDLDDWPVSWLAQMGDIPPLIVGAALRGWRLAKRREAEAA